MVFKYKSNTIYKLVITLLISLLMLMLYLGNYNLIEGNDTKLDVENKLHSVLQKNKNISNALIDATPYTPNCPSDKEMNDNNTDTIERLGGADAYGAQSTQIVNQSNYNLCSMVKKNNV